jgi:hypothetical protein
MQVSAFFQTVTFLNGNVTHRLQFGVPGDWIQVLVHNRLMVPISCNLFKEDSLPVDESLFLFPTLLVLEKTLCPPTNLYSCFLHYSKSLRHLNPIPHIMSSTSIPAPLNLDTPKGTQSIYATALSTRKEKVEAVITWASKQTEFSETFVGPTKSFVMFGKVFGLPLVEIDPKSEKITLYFNFSGGYHYEVSGPTKAGPEGSSTVYEVTAYDNKDTKKAYPTVVTILFEGTLHL